LHSTRYLKETAPEGALRSHEGAHPAYAISRRRTQSLSDSEVVPGSFCIHYDIEINHAYPVDDHFSVHLSSVVHVTQRGPLVIYKKMVCWDLHKNIVLVPLVPFVPYQELCQEDHEVFADQPLLV
jgi:hypothetical protein